MLVLGAALSLLAMPVTYRGGAEEPHAHVFFQVWIDAAHGSFVHHHADAAPHHETAHRTAAPLAPRARPDFDGPTSSAPTVPEVRGLVLALATGAVVDSRRAAPVPGLPVHVPPGRTVRPLFPPPRLAAVL